MRIFNRLHKAIGLLEYFSSQDWEWNSENLSMLMSQLTPEDRKVSGSMCVFVCVRLIGPKKTRMFHPWSQVFSLCLCQPGAVWLNPTQ